MIPGEIRETILELGSLAAEVSRSAEADYLEVKAWLRSLPESPEPDWTQAPEWAQWWAIDASGVARWYHDRPMPFFIRWEELNDVPPSERMRRAELPIGIDWRTTLRERPK